MDLVKDLYGNGKLYRLSMDPSGIDISGETQVLRINSDKITGNLNIDGIVGIGKKPREKLDVNGNVRIFGADTPRYLDFYWNDANGLLDDTYGYAYPNGVRFFNNQDTDDTTDSDLNSYGIAGEILHYGGPGETYSNGFDFKTHSADGGWWAIGSFKLTKINIEKETIVGTENEYLISLSGISGTTGNPKAFDIKTNYGNVITINDKDQKGTRYFLVKNSWGTGNYPEGYLYVSESYFKWKTINIYLHKDGLSKDMKKKLDLPK